MVASNYEGQSVLVAGVRQFGLVGNISMESFRFLFIIFTLQSCGLCGLCGLLKLWGSHSACQSVLVAGVRQIGLVCILTREPIQFF